MYWFNMCTVKRQFSFPNDQFIHTRHACLIHKLHSDGKDWTQKSVQYPYTYIICTKKDKKKDRDRERLQEG